MEINQESLKTQLSNAILIDNPEARRYEIKLNDKIAFCEYIKTKDKIFLTHTEVPKGLEGIGVASTLIGKVMLEVEKSGLQLVPLCPYVALYLNRNPDWKKLVLKGINIE